MMAAKSLNFKRNMDLKLKILCEAMGVKFK